MKKLFFILLIIVIASFNSFAADRSVQCMSLFASSKKNASVHINEMIAPFEVKKRLLQQTLYNRGIRDFVVEFSEHINDLYTTRFAEALELKNEVNYLKLGFNSIDEVRLLKETVINKQIKVLSIMNPNDLTPEFAADFKRIASRLYDTKTTREEVLTLNSRLDGVLLSYNSDYSRM